MGGGGRGVLFSKPALTKAVLKIIAADILKYFLIYFSKKTKLDFHVNYLSGLIL